MNVYRRNIFYVHHVTIFREHMHSARLFFTLNCNIQGRSVSLYHLSMTSSGKPPVIGLNLHARKVYVAIGERAIAEWSRENQLRKSAVSGLRPFAHHGVPAIKSRRPASVTSACARYATKESLTGGRRILVPPRWRMNHRRSRRVLSGPRGR